MTIPAQFHKAVRYEIEDGKNETFNALPQWLQKKIGLCLEWNTDHADSEESSIHTAADNAAETKDEVPF